MSEEVNNRKIINNFSESDIQMRIHHDQELLNQHKIAYRTIIFLSFFITIVTIVYIFILTPSDKISDISKSNIDEIILSENNNHANKNIDDEESHVVDSEIKLEGEPVSNHVSKISSIEDNKNNEVDKIRKDKLSFHKSKNDDVVFSFNKAKKHNLDELLSNRPEDVWPIIKDEYPEYFNNIRLLALSAQGQQRSGQHRSALYLYQRLNSLDPENANWLIASAISLDQLGKRKLAFSLYSQALDVKDISPSLRDFSQKRIKLLQGGEKIGKE